MRKRSKPVVWSKVDELRLRHRLKTNRMPALPDKSDLPRLQREAEIALRANEAELLNR
jgi:hypothetical protein